MDYSKDVRQFYDCLPGGSTASPYTYCKLEKNSKYYAVIIVPTLAFAAVLIGLFLFFKTSICKTGYAQPQPEKTTSTWI
jgi:hypothetical protein